MRYWLIAASLAALLCGGSSRAEERESEILRDGWGIPHVFAAADEGAFYGLGYATAEDRAFQMTYALRIIQGRLSEVIGEVRKVSGNETSVIHDRRMRTFGFYRAAQRTADRLDPETLGLLRAYCDGVNAYFHDHAEKLHPLFAQTGLSPEPWTPADCLASWWHLGQFFATDGTRDLIAARNLSANSAPGRSGQAGRGRTSPDPPPGLEPLPPDDGPAVVKRTDLPPEWIDRTYRYADEHGLQCGQGAEGPKFSHT